MPVKCIINFAGNAQTKDVSFTLYVDFFRVELRAKRNESFKNKRKAFFGKIWAQITMKCSFLYGTVLHTFCFSAKLKWHTILKGLEREKVM